MISQGKGKKVGFRELKKTAPFSGAEDSGRLLSQE